MHSSGNKGYNKTTESHLSRAPPPWWGWRTVCSVNTDFPSQSGSVHREPSPSCQMLMEAFLWGQETSYAAREAATVGPGSGGCLGHRSGLREAHKKVLVTAKPKGEVSPPCLHGAAPSVRFRHPPAEPPAQVGSIASRILTGSPGRYGPANPSKTQREPAIAADALHSNRRRPVWSVALYPAPSRLREGPITATLGLGPRGPGCPFRPASFAAPAPHLGLSAAWSAQKSNSRAGRQLRAQGSSSPAHLAWPRPPGLTIPSRRAADSQPPSYHPTTTDARVAGNLR